MINTRDEAHADPALHRRLHVIVGDSSVCQATTLLKVGSTDLVLRLIEAGAGPPGLEVTDPIRALREVSHALPGTGRVALADGRVVSGLDIVEAWLEAVEGWEADDAGPRPGDDAVLGLWRRAVDALRSGDLTGVERELDWVIKRRLIERYRSRTGASLLDPRVARLELAYHDIGPAGLGRRAEDSGAIARVVGEEEVRAAIVHPPATTRAALRGRFVRAARAAGADHTVDWTHLKLGAPAVASVTLMDPFAADDERVDDLIASLGGGGGEGEA
jgi:proteasome accessory factor A